MPLLSVPEHRPEDLDVWERECRLDPVWCRDRGYQRRVARSAQVVADAADRLGYCSVSWGKDSVCVAHLVAQLAPHVPLVWVRIEPIANPYCPLVRDVFRERFPGQPYEEIEVWCRYDEGEWKSTDAAEEGFEQASRKYPGAYISGIRAKESGTRRLRCARWGEQTSNTVAPLAWWSGRDVFAYLAEHDLPIHPAYAMNMAGAISRERIRVSSVGGRRGDGRGRSEWEARYYGRRESG